MLRDRARYDLGYRSGVLGDLNGPLTDALVLLTGPRRVGKSVVLLDLAASLCDRSDLIPFQIIYVPCDAMVARDLRRAFTLGQELTRPADRPDPLPRVWLLDEVSAIGGWTAIVKAAATGLPSATTRSSSQEAAGERAKTSKATSSLVAPGRREPVAYVTFTQ